MFQSREKLTGGIFPNEKKISRLLSVKQPADLFPLDFGLLVIRLIGHDPVRTIDLF